MAYAQGFYFDLQTKVTKGGIMRLCRSLEARFGSGNVFVPDGVGYGFIHWASWPGKTEETAYKSIRKCPRTNTGTQEVWPWVESDAVTTWVENKEVALLPGSYCTTLRALTGATAWTDNELRILIACLEDEGFFVTKKPGFSRRGGAKKRKLA
jgi:hypothetical protein